MLQQYFENNRNKKSWETKRIEREYLEGRSYRVMSVGMGGRPRFLLAAIYATHTMLGCFNYDNGVFVITLLKYILVAPILRSSTLGVNLDGNIVISCQAHPCFLNSKIANDTQQETN